MSLTGPTVVLPYVTFTDVVRLAPRVSVDSTTYVNDTVRSPFSFAVASITFSIASNVATYVGALLLSSTNDGLLMVPFLYSWLPVLTMLTGLVPTDTSSVLPLCGATNVTASVVVPCGIVMFTTYVTASPIATLGVTVSVRLVTALFSWNVTPLSVAIVLPATLVLCVSDCAVLSAVP